MKKRGIINWNKVIQGIKSHDLFELRFLFTELKRFKKVGRGKVYFYCPFHFNSETHLPETHPSCNWVFACEYFYCFGCGERGSIIRYYMLRREVNFHQAVIELAKIFKIKIKWGYLDNLDDYFQKKEQSSEDYSDDYPYDDDDLPF